jgi:heme o synthase
MTTCPADFALSETRADSSARVSDYVALLKTKVMSLVVFSGFAGMYVAPGFAQLHPVVAFIAMMSLALGAGAAGAINMWYDADIDAVMTRTRMRPIPSGRVAPDAALAFGVVIALFSVMTMYLAAGPLPAFLLAFSIFFYVVVYTMGLKRRTPQNIVIGGAAGAFPPMIGWAVASGEITSAAIALFALIFFWTPPHFWALALLVKDDYARVGVPMLPNVAGDAATKRQMFIYTLILLPVSVLPTLLGIAGLVYGVGAAVLSGLFIVSAWRVWHSTDRRLARMMFGYSILYLFALFTLLMMDKVVP